MSGETSLDQIDEAHRVVEELGGKKTKDLNELRSELDRMIEEFKKSGNEHNCEILLKQRALVISTMETALDMVMHGTLDSTRTETPAKAVPPSQAPTQSAFVPESTTPASALSSTEKPKNAWQKFLEGAGTFFSSIGTYVTNLWKSWFGKKEDAPAPEVKTETPTAAATTTPETITPTIPETTTPTGADTTNPSTPDEATQAVETVSLMDGAAHDIAGHELLWTGKADDLLSLDGKKFGVSTINGVLLNGLRSITKKGDTLVIDTVTGIAELDPVQTNELMNQIVNGKPTTKTSWFGGETYQALPITVMYTSVATDGTRTPSSRDIELLPNGEK